MLATFHRSIEGFRLFGLAQIWSFPLCKSTSSNPFCAHFTSYFQTSENVFWLILDQKPWKFSRNFINSSRSLLLKNHKAAFSVSKEQWQLFWSHSMLTVVQNEILSNSVPTLLLVCSEYCQRALFISVHMRSSFMLYFNKKI